MWVVTSVAVPIIIGLGGAYMAFYLQRRARAEDRLADERDWWRKEASEVIAEITFMLEHLDPERMKTVDPEIRPTLAVNAMVTRKPLNTWLLRLLSHPDQPAVGNAVEHYRKTIESAILAVAAWSWMTPMPPERSTEYLRVILEALTQDPDAPGSEWNHASEQRINAAELAAQERISEALRAGRDLTNLLLQLGDDGGQFRPSAMSPL